jgi:hypothetical protein
MNSGLPWSTELIEHYQDNWNLTSLILNVALPWSIELIERYQEKWNWEKLESKEYVYSKIFKGVLTDRMI